MHSFKSALKTSLIFLLIITVLSTVIMYPYFHRETYHYQDGYVRDNMAGEIDFIICGASQAQRGISTEILDKELGVNSYNIASPLMTLMGRYTILKKEAERNPVDTVIVELCYDTLVRDRDEVGAEGDYYMLGRFTSFAERAEYFFKAARFDEYADFYNDMLYRGIQSWKSIRNNAVGTSENYETKGFAALETYPIEMIAEEDYNQEEILTDLVDENVEYLNKILEYCKKNNIKVIIMATPLADAAILSYDKLDIIHDVYREISEKWDCEYYNFSLYKGKSEMWKDSDSYFDRNHLSAAGAESFSYVLSDVISASLEGKDSYELFYDTFAQAQGEEIIPYHSQNK